MEMVYIPKSQETHGGVPKGDLTVGQLDVIVIVSIVVKMLVMIDRMSWGSEKWLFGGTK